MTQVHRIGTAHAELEPQPGLAQLHSLVDRSSRLDCRVIYASASSPRALSRLDLAVYQVIQVAHQRHQHAGKPPTP